MKSIEPIGKTADRTNKTVQGLRTTSEIRGSAADTGTKTSPMDRDQRTLDYTADRSHQNLTPKDTLTGTGDVSRPDRTTEPAPGGKTERDPSARMDKNTPVKLSDPAGPAPDKAARDIKGTAPQRTVDSSRVPTARLAGDVPALQDGTDGTTSPITINGNNNNIYLNGGDVNLSRYSGSRGYYHGYYPRPYYAHRHHTLIFNFGWTWSSDWYYYHGAYILDTPWVGCGRMISVPWYNGWGVTYYYPHYHRRFMFVSLGGYWPSYRYRRYYWYGCHPYRWYDYDVVYDTQPVVNNYYYNTYTTETPATGTTQYDDFGDVREKLQREKMRQQLDQAEDKPNDETAADRNFSEAVEAFERGDYNEAILKFRVAMVLEPSDIILPFAYSQALFARGDYEAAAASLRAVLMSMVPPIETTAQTQDESQDTVYYPRGLYKKPEYLQQQIQALAARVAANPNNTDLQLLLGYHLLGSGQADKALIPLGEASKDPANREAVRILLNLREKVLEDQKVAASAVAAPIAAPNGASAAAPATSAPVMPNPAPAQSQPAAVQPTPAQTAPTATTGPATTTVEQPARKEDL